MGKTFGYEFFEHTADLGVNAYGRDLAELFENSARGMYAVLGRLDGIEPSIEKLIEIRAQNEIELLQGWLSELLYAFDTGKLYMVKFDIVEINSNYLKAYARGGRYSGKEGQFEHEIKAVTYHGMEVKRQKDGFTARILFDI